MTHKPLTMDRLGGIATRIQYDLHGTVSDDAKADLEDLLQDVMYWREAVKNASFYTVCPFCDGRMAKSITRGLNRPIEHKPDCPRLLAQEGE